MSNKVYVVTGTDLGWDCVVGVFSAVEVNYAGLRHRFPERQYVITKREVESSLADYEDWDC